MNQEWTFTSHSPDDTANLAERLGRLVKRGNVITLAGDLGAGKTTFTKALAKSVGVTRNVNSPTFTIMKEYEGFLPFYHMDAYRIEDEMEDLGLEEYFEGSGVTVVEWPAMILDQLPKDRLDITIQYTGEEERVFLFHAYGDHYLSLCKELFEA
ncbi:tRNA (adenosine(37)-N6)-threonylcarbamoyltransferase complex ATPase subunit type 1 TsaE [Salipaludibacillus keqinensis]|uniref:tRNA threonylcarbamoyladenosine biosynthesis protein TsaE n=1 Tax=Salipaludibacillus keqinensis TaxID=2045207 RepID=A0A323THQ0_9BACI|nr:tRNA (adenosine(37)-N6)-threonylcarbamoyltransferase complex ATPase subunit type 1 TsaE [Salipaludibacillus keqinensis]PYZ92153.1 tRNA (adenosine(37)-N6)-threonylcarbamoyltransferase complex ATPase subunit type 1 TsaE [Salipaludibacillus keqinensis]